MSPPPPLQFVSISHPDEVSQWKRQVRSHASRNSKARQRRVLDYQSNQSQPDAGTDRERDSSSPDSTATTTSSKAGKRARTRSPPRPSNAGGTELVFDINDSEEPGTSARRASGSPQSSLSAARTDPFSSLVQNLSRWERFLIDHFVQEVVLASRARDDSVYGVSLDEAENFRQGLASYWVQMGTAHPGVLAGIFLAASRSMAGVGDREAHTQQALGYKNQCIRLLIEACEAEFASDATITMTLALAADDASAGDLEAAETHLLSVANMARLRGGPEKLGRPFFRGTLVTWFVNDTENQPKEPSRLLFDTATIPPNAKSNPVWERDQPSPRMYYSSAMKGQNAFVLIRTSPEPKAR